MPLSSDPEKRERQLANLSPNWPRNRSGKPAARSPERSGEQRPKAPERSAEKRPSSGRKRRVVKHPPAEPAAKPKPPEPKEPADGGPTEEPEPERRRGFLAGLRGDY